MALCLGIQIPAWCVDPKFRTGFRKYPQRPHSVFPDEAASSETSEHSSPASEQRDDNAINDPALKLGGIG